jgi:hypothetical protein
MFTVVFELKEAFAEIGLPTDFDVSATEDAEETVMVLL